ncbi:MAG: hypothetical protein WCJ26_07170 [bacterium]
MNSSIFPGTMICCCRMMESGNHKLKNTPSGVRDPGVVSLFQYNLDSGSPGTDFIPVLLSEESIGISNWQSAKQSV